jgi:hypothetical protein
VALNFPDSPTLNQVYTDSTSGFSYQWDGVVWKSYSPSSSNTIQGIDDISASFNNSTQSFPLTSNTVALSPVNVQQLEINLGGVIQAAGIDYTISGSNIVFTTAPTQGLTFSGKILGLGIPVNYANDGNVYYRQIYTATAGQTVFSFTNTYTVGYLDVYRNGVRLSSGIDFIAINGTTFTLTVASQVNDEIEAVGYRIASLVTTLGIFNNLNVSGVITGRTLSSGFGTAISGNVTSPLSSIYYNDQVLSIGQTVTVDVPSSAIVGYTAHAEVAVDVGYDLIVADGDEFVPNILGIGTTGVGGGIGLMGGGGRVRADNYANKAGTGAPTFTNGVNVTGVITATSFISTGSTGISLQISGNRVVLTAVGIGSTSFILA